MPKETRTATLKRTGECISQGLPKKQNQKQTHIILLRIGSMIWGLESLKSIEKAGRLEVQVKVDFIVLSPISAGQQVGNSGRVPMLQY